MKSRKNKKDRIGTIVFLVPVVLIIGVVVYGFLQVTAPGTLTVEALTVNRYLPAGSQNETVQVSILAGTATGVTPVSLSLAAGAYEVSFDTIPWYHTPSPREVEVVNRQTVYATGVYDVIVKVVQVTPTGFNTTSVSAEHGVTPVVWVNTSNSPVLFGIQPSGTHSLDPGQNLTTIFPSAGNFVYTLEGNGATSSGEVFVQ